MANPTLTDTGQYVTFFKGNTKTRAEQATKGTKAIETARRAAYKAVDARDKDVCRCCGRKVLTTLRHCLEKRERHHIDGRGGVARETTRNIAVLCLECHELRHVKRVLTISGNADRPKGLRFERDGKVWHG